MQGLRRQEDNEFEAFFKIVQNFAKEKRCVFFLDAGEGNEIQLSGIDGENLSGWLIPIEQVDEFEKVFVQSKHFNDIPEKYIDYFCFAKWEINNNKIYIRFVKK